MDVLQDRWQRASRGVLHNSPTLTERGLLLVYGTVLVHCTGEGYQLDADAERCLCLLSIAQRRPQEASALHCLRRAVASWQRGDEALAHIHLAFGRFLTIDRPEDAWREATGAMIEAKGHYASVVATQWGRDILQRKWLKQARRKSAAQMGARSSGTSTMPLLQRLRRAFSRQRATIDR